MSAVKADQAKKADLAKIVLTYPVCTEIGSELCQLVRTGEFLRV